MANLNETAVNILNEMFPEMKNNPLAISKGMINKYFKDLEFNKTQIFSIEQRTANEEGFNKAYKLSCTALPLIDVERVNQPVNVANVNEEATVGMVSLPSHSPKQIIKGIKDNGKVLTKYESAETYTAIFQALYIEAEDSILNCQIQQLKGNLSIKLKSNSQRVLSYYSVNPNGSIYDCAELLGLMPIQVIQLRKATLYEFEEEEMKPFVMANIIR